ncbi:MAG TPA: hypothetical protein VHI52_14900, partial [Verrucomicrobiae bacterium]|nr:hypothetical protein [Verrucomicrobiae bacterium]
QTSVNLAGLGLEKPLASITFTMQANAGTRQTTAIFAVSGKPRDPTVLTAVPGKDGIRLAWSGSGTLLESTNPAGPWLTNTAASSPALIIPGQPKMFYRVQTP